MRVVAGSVGGRRLVSVPGRGTRPTADRVREALFSALGERVIDATVLDLYAGSGALGIEALSRGARSCVFVERAAPAAQTVRRNLQALDLTARALLVHADATAFCRSPRGGPFDLIFCDPPYDLARSVLLERLGELRAQGALAPDATAMLERDRRDEELDLEWPAWLALVSQRSYGETVLVRLVFAEGYS